MDAREAYHRRAYRVALVLTDAEGRALRILEDVARAIPSPQTVSDARFDRAVIQASRPSYESRAREGTGDGTDGLAERLGLSEHASDLWARAHALSAQELEAWVLCEAEGMETVRAARAMDCSRNALERIHLPAAKKRLASDAYDASLDEIARALASLDTDHALAHIEGVLAEHRRRSRLVTAVSLVLLLAAFAIMIYVLFDLLAWQGREDALRSGASEALSNPLPDDADTDASP
ncbi:MAG: hypothetical protein AAGH64_08845 [Planctomycetota bacterium]